MKKIAYIVNDRVAYIIKCKQLITADSSDEYVVDITGLSPEPDVGWKYNSLDDTIYNDLTEAEEDALDKLVVMEEVDNKAYKQARKDSSPDIEEQMDSVISVLEHLERNGVDLGPEAEALFNAASTVKKDHPKKIIKHIFPKD